MASKHHNRAEQPPRRLRRLLRRLFLVLLLLAGLVLAAPTLLSQPALQGARGVLLARALPAGWRLDCEQASLGWMSQQSLTGVVLTDAQGQRLLEVESLTLSKPLLSLVLSQSHLGKIELLRPLAFVQTRPDGSNWQALQESPAAPSAEASKASAQGVELEITVVEGAVRGFDQATGQQWSVEAANLTATLGAGLQASGSALLATDGSNQQGQVQFRWQPEADGGHQLELLAERMPLAPLEAWLASQLPGVQLAGQVSTDAQLHWRMDAQRGLLLETSGRLEASQLEVSADLLQGDALRCQQLSAPWKLSLADGQIAIEQLSVESDWATLQGQGVLERDDFLPSVRGAPGQHATGLSGKIDLAKLAQMLPRTLQLRQGVRVDSGVLDFTLANQEAGQPGAWIVQAVLENVAGSEGQRQLRWEAPIHLTAQWSDAATGFRWETATLEAPFGQATCQTDQGVTSGQFELNLAEFSEQLNQFVDLRPWQLRGLGEGDFQWQRGADQQWRTNVQLELTELQLAEGNRSVWEEPKLQVTLAARGQAQQLLAEALLTVQGPRDQLQLTLQEPLQLGAAQPAAQFQVVGSGALALWASRLRPWLAGVPERLEGEAQIDARLFVSRERIEVLASTGSVTQLRVAQDGLLIDEPRVEFSGDATWAAQQIASHEFELLASSCSCRARQVRIVLGAAPTAQGELAFSADLERLAALTGGLGALWPRGTAVGQLKLASDAQQLQAEFGFEVERLALLRSTTAPGQSETLWSEPKLALTGRADYTMATDRVQFHDLKVQGQTLQLSSTVRIDQVRSAPQLETSGLVEYAPQQLAQLIASYAGPGIQWQGDGQVRFQVAGPLKSSSAHWSERWQWRAEAGWQQGTAYGLPLGGGRLKAEVRAGELKFAPLEVAVAEGQLTAEPLVRLVPAPETLVLSRGPLVSQVAVSQEVSETMLKYVAPILAGATRVEGQFSVDLEQAVIPLDHPKGGQIAGRLVTHQLNVSPGPMTEQLITLVKQIESLSKREPLQAVAAPRGKRLLTMTEQAIDFQVSEGRVYHRNLEFLIDGVPVRSRGSVGFDQTLALELEVPIQEKWIEREPALRGLAGQSLRIPIQGTFQQPRIDERAVADLSRQLLQGAASQAIGTELNRQLEKLFGK